MIEERAIWMRAREELYQESTGNGESFMLIPIGMENTREGHFDATVLGLDDDTIRYNLIR